MGTPARWIPEHQVRALLWPRPGAPLATVRWRFRPSIGGHGAQGRVQGNEPVSCSPHRLERNVQRGLPTTRRDDEVDRGFTDDCAYRPPKHVDDSPATSDGRAQASRTGNRAGTHDRRSSLGPQPVQQAV